MLYAEQYAEHLYQLRADELNQLSTRAELAECSVTQLQNQVADLEVEKLQRQLELIEIKSAAERAVLAEVVTSTVTGTTGCVTMLLTMTFTHQ